MIGLGTAALSTFGSLPTATAGTAVPWQDTSQHGTLTFCDSNGQPVTSGSLYTRPFVWKTLSSVPAPQGYRQPQARASLFIYQPIQYVDPADWSGSQLTGGSSFSNAAHPNVQATNGDSSILGFSNAYPSHWAHLYQVRMYFTAINQPQQNQTYPAAVIRVSGSRWTLVQGGGTACSASHGVSNEVHLLPKKERHKLLSRPHNGAPTGAKSSLGSGTQSPTAGPGGGNQESPGTTTSPVNVADSSGSSGGLGTGAKTAIGLGVLALIVAVGGLSIARRHQREGATGETQ
jgi:hypothetical protein